jgi:glycosyltransferase involved in cell wall biosynthesis
MSSRKKIFFTVTNDLSFDQRMIRICTTMAAQNYKVVLVGRKIKQSIKLTERTFSQKRLCCIFNKGFLFYGEYNIRLFLFLLLQKADIICAIDLDTIMPCYFISRIKKITRVYDAHELFCEMKEVVTRPLIYKCWKAIEKYFVPEYKYGYTVNGLLAKEFFNMYASGYAVIRNLPVMLPLLIPQKKERYFLYQGAVNEGRSFETLIPAMKHTDAKLIICGEGNFMRQARQLVKDNDLQDKIIFKGKIIPEELRHYTIHAWAGITLFENTGLSNYLSLGNRFFDYLHAGIPQLCVGYPLYKEINEQFEVAVTISDCTVDEIVHGLKILLNDEGRYGKLQQNCLAAREVYNWQEEEKKLVAFYRAILIK